MKYKKIIVFAYIFIMIALFVISITNLVINENYKRVYDISIIFDDVNSSKYNKLKMGIEDSTLELSVDINYVYLEDKSNLEEQENAILKESQKDVDGIIIIPINSDEIGSFIDENSIKTPIVSIDKKINSKRNIPVVTTDYEELGNNLANDILEKFSDKNIVSFTQTTNNDKRLYNAISNTLENNGIEDKLICYDDDNFIQNVNQFNKKDTVFIALDSYTTQKFIDKFVSKYDMTLYGFGYFNEFIYDLNLQQIEGLCFYDEYLTGYLAVQDLVYFVDGKLRNKNRFIPNYLVLNDDVYSYENVLFPID